MKMTPVIAGILAATIGLTGVTAANAQGRSEGPRADFSELDADGNGEVTIAEMQAYGKARADARFAEADTNGDGSLSAEELLAQRDSDRAERRIDRMIERMDADGNGTLERAELTRDGEDQSERMEKRFSRLDTDESGGLSEEEMAAAKEKRGGDRKGRKGGNRG